MKPDVMIVGTDRLGIARTDVLTKRFQQKANIVETCAINGGMNWNTFRDKLDGKTHVLFVLDKNTPRSCIELMKNTDAQMATHPTLGVLFLDDDGFDEHHWVTDLSSVHFAAAPNDHAHAKIPSRCFRTMVVRDVMQKAGDIAKMFLQ